MRTGRPALTLVLLLMAAPLAVLAWVVSSADRSIGVARWVVSTATPYSLSLSNASLTWRPLRFRADLLQLRYADEKLPPLVAGQRIDLAMPLRTLWDGSAPREGSFSARNVTYYLDGSAGGGAFDLEALLSPLGWLPGKVDIDSVHLIRRGDDVRVFPLRNLSGRRVASGSLALVTEADFAGRRVVLEALGDWSRAPGDAHWLTVEAALFGPDDDSRLELSGRMEAQEERLSYRFALDGDYDRVGDFFAAFDDDAFGVDGALSIHGLLTGDMDGYELWVEELTLTADDSYRFAADGRITGAGDGAATLALEARGDVRRLRELLPVPETLSTLVDESELELTLAGTLQEPRLAALGVVLEGPGQTRIAIASPALNVDLAQLETVDSLEGMALRLEGSSGDLPALLSAAGVATPEQIPATASLRGELQVRGEELRVELSRIDASSDAYEVWGSADALWRADTLSLPRLDITLAPRASKGEITARGSIADLVAARGMALDVAIADLDPRLIGRLLEANPALPAGLGVDASARLVKAADAVWLRDLRGRLRSGSGLDASLKGDLLVDRASPEGDLEFSIDAEDGAYAGLELLRGPDRAEGKLRLRPAYLTGLATLNYGASDLQAVANADLTDGTLASLAVDVWGANTRLEDFMPPEGKDGSKQKDTKAAEASKSGPAVWTKRLPRVPLHLTLRSQRLYSEHAELRDVALAIEGENGKLVLRRLDSRYDDGDLSLRGILDLNTTPPSLSLAGRVIRVPLGALTEDLGLQQSISGELSLQGGLSAQGSAVDELSRSLRGQLAVALSDMTVSGAAYDLLMSNLLAWLVQGAAEKTTTFDCTMMHFAVQDGVAKADALYVETPRMRATGKGRIDLPGQRMDFRIEPRSKSRTFQFPSAVRLRGPLADPSVEVSGLQATADLSAQTLLLLPSLTLKLFGVGGADDDAPRPCRAAIADG